VEEEVWRNILLALFILKMEAIRSSGTLIRTYQSYSNSNFDFFLPDPRVEAGSNTSTVALRIVGGDEMGAQSLGV
jgi:hypothetical protein